MTDSEHVNPRVQDIIEDYQHILEEWNENDRRIKEEEITESNAFSLARRLVSLQHEISMNMRDFGDVGQAPPFREAGEANRVVTEEILNALDEGDATSLKRYIQERSDTFLRSPIQHGEPEQIMRYGENLRRMVGFIPDRLPPSP